MVPGLGEDAEDVGVDQRGVVQGGEKTLFYGLARGAMVSRARMLSIVIPAAVSASGRGKTSAER